MLARHKKRGAGGKIDSRKKFANNVLTPAVLTAITLVLLIWVLSNVNFDIRYSLGASTIIFASFGGSAFLLFMMPTSRTARLSSFVKSYAIAVVLGSAGYFIIPYLGIYYTSALMIFLISLLLIVTDSVHPSAVSLLFAYLLYDVSYIGDIVVAIGVAIIIIIRFYLERYVFVLEEDVEKGIKKLKNRNR